jgi:hypothetical protein
VETPLARGILAGLYPPGSTIIADGKPSDDKLTFSVLKPSEPSNTADEKSSLLKDEENIMQ